MPEDTVSIHPFAAVVADKIINTLKTYFLKEKNICN